ncbi:MAG TPA: MarR family transcriptional regulator [Vicinamibacteria bacterium]|nr:MarR family transcriptional regulator [Vicinamibacteria bacterium]
MGSIRDEIKQRKPFESVADEAVVTLLATADRVRTVLAQVVESHGTTLQQYNVLRILRGAGDAGLPTLDLAARMIEHSPGVTRLVDRLEARRLVRRVRCPEDRRQVLCHATASARRLLAGIDHPLAEAARGLFASLDDARTTELILLLDAVRATAASAATTKPTAEKDQSELSKEMSR